MASDRMASSSETTAHDLESKRTRIDDTLHDPEDELTLQDGTGEVTHQAAAAAGAAGDFVRRHPVATSLALGLAAGAVSARYGFRGRRRARAVIDRRALRELIDYGALRDAVVEGGTAGSQAAQRFARRTVRGIATSRPLRALPTRSALAHSIEGLSGSGLGTLALAIGAGVALALSRRSAS